MNSIKGYKTYIVGFLMVVAPPALTYLAGLDWTKIVSPQWAPVIAGAAMIALRSVTNTPPGKSS